jgi:hypothetical protein
MLTSKDCSEGLKKENHGTLMSGYPEKFSKYI